MASCVMRTAWPALGGTSKSLSIYPRTWLNASVYLNVPSSTTILIQKRSLFASLGGTTALFVGASVLTVVETIIFILRLIFNPGNFERTDRVRSIHFTQ